MSKMRSLLFSALVVFGPTCAALADENISGQWQADMGNGVMINMDILADGHWFSQTIQDDKVVAEMAGTYEQTPKDDANGRVVFTPLKSKVSEEHGAAKVEDDTYSLTDGGKELTLTTGDQVMKFENSTKE